MVQPTGSRWSRAEQALKTAKFGLLCISAGPSMCTHMGGGGMQGAPGTAELMWPLAQVSQELRRKELG